MGEVDWGKEYLYCPRRFVESESVGLPDPPENSQKPMELRSHSVGRTSSRPARGPENERNQLSTVACRASSHPPPAFRTFAHRKFLEGFDVVILGHSHFPDEVEEWMDGRRCSYFNVGDWAIHQSFLRFTPPDLFRLERFEIPNGECELRKTDRKREQDQGEIDMGKVGQVHPI